MEKKERIAKLKYRAYLMYTRDQMGGYKSIAKWLGLNTWRVRDWCRDFKSGAYEAEMPKCESESYEEKKALVIKGRKAGQSYTSLGREHKVSVNLVKYWVKTAEQKELEISTKIVDKQKENGG